MNRLEEYNKEFVEPLLAHFGNPADFIQERTFCDIRLGICFK